MRDEQREVAQAAALRLRSTAIALAGAVVSKPTAKKTTCALGIARARARARRAASRRCARRRRRPWRRGDRRSEPGTRSMSPKEQRIDARAAPAIAMRLSMQLDRRHADRAAGPVDQRDLGRQQLVDAEADDRVGLAAADLHQRPRSRHEPRGCASAKRRAAPASRYSSTYFIAPVSTPAPSSRPSSADLLEVARRRAPPPRSSTRLMAKPTCTSDVVADARPRARRRGRSP